ncbi:hypothetical protein M0811_08209 [Anaeramoeba ignava]|uniref:Uncharacterized protein n=1 Tax=Anaeramoeba ignava TaxID=1746090 RepID=A0A9Q0LJS1_ANAIG|nr:hypothetical protein M0811_08209 [Anaeramoeba ignava]
MYPPFRQTFNYPMIIQFMKQTNCENFEESMRFLVWSGWDLNFAICLRSLCFLQSNSNEQFLPNSLIETEEYKKQTPEHITISESIENPNNQETTKMRSKRKTSPSPDEDILQTEDALDSQLSQNGKRTKTSTPPPAKQLSEVLHGRPITEELLHEFLLQKPAPRWQFRLDAFQKLHPNFLAGWPEEFDACMKAKSAINDPTGNPRRSRMFKIAVNKDLLDQYPQNPSQTKFRSNLQRGLIKFFENKGFSYSKNETGSWIIFSQWV